LTVKSPSLKFQKSEAHFKVPTDTYTSVQTVGDIKIWSSDKQTALLLCRVQRHYYTDRTASVDHTVSQIKKIVE